MEKENTVCPFCGPLAAQTKESLNGSYRQYDQILRKLMELERQGRMELYRLPLCALPQMRRPLFFGRLHSGRARVSAGPRHPEGKPGHPAVGPVRDLLFAGKKLKQASTRTSQNFPGKCAWFAMRS